MVCFNLFPELSIFSPRDTLLLCIYSSILCIIGNVTFCTCANRGKHTFSFFTQIVACHHSVAFFILLFSRSEVVSDQSTLNMILICIKNCILVSCIVVKSLSRVRLFVTPWPIAHQAPPCTRKSVSCID